VRWRSPEQEDVIIDVGANVGHFSMLLADLVDPADIIAFEPVPVSFARLVANWRANEWSTDKLFQAAAGARSGVVRMPDTTSPLTTVHVPLTTLDAVRHLWRGRSMGLVKIDVEGYEPLVLPGHVPY
jgi:FkbM family methyltransferase